MTKHQTGTRAEWLAARLELLEAEKELTHKGDEVARRRQELPWVRIDKEYRFDTDEGSASLADLFRGRSQLLVYHFMFGPDYTAGCPACSAIADGFNGFALHLANHDVTLAAVSRAPLAKLQGYKRRMGWRFPWASSFGSDFNADFSRPGRRVTWPAAGRCPGAARRCRPMPARPGVTACASVSIAARAAAASWRSSSSSESWTFARWSWWGWPSPPSASPRRASASRAPSGLGSGDAGVWTRIGTIVSEAQHVQGSTVLGHRLENLPSDARRTIAG
jgi:hypothetical protein